jgi:hypothetical protein
MAEKKIQKVGIAPFSVIELSKIQGQKNYFQTPIVFSRTREVIMKDSINISVFRNQVKPSTQGYLVMTENLRKEELS